MHALLVEDDALVASGTAAGLRLHDAAVDHVETAQAGRNALQAAHFDLAILDLGLSPRRLAIRHNSGSAPEHRWIYFGAFLVHLPLSPIRTASYKNKYICVYYM